MVIDGDGLFNGSRWRRCSNAARLNAPYLMLAANGHGRLEIDPLRIIARAYATFDPRPTEAQILGFVREYADANLVFLYEFEGQRWGQWDTPDRLLPRYKTASDQRSPEPPEPDFSEWKSRYRVPGAILLKPSEIFPKVSGKSSETFLLGDGDGDGDGDGKNTCAPSGARVGDVQQFSLTEHPPIGPDQREGWFTTFWAKYKVLRNRDRKGAHGAFLRVAKTQAAFDAIMHGLDMQTAELLERDPSKRPHASTWLAGERWEDSNEGEAPAKDGSGSVMAKALKIFSREDD